MSHRANRFTEFSDAQLTRKQRTKSRPDRANSTRGAIFLENQQITTINLRKGTSPTRPVDLNWENLVFGGLAKGYPILEESLAKTG